MKVIGLTGGIAAGKSTVSAMLRSLGATVIDADVLSRSVTARGGAALAPIRRAFGDGVFLGDELNRAALADLVFGDAAKRELLNAIVHPLVYAQIEGLKEQARARGEKAVVLDIPLLFETGYEKMCDEVWVVCLDEAQQLARLMLRDGVDGAGAKRKMEAQMPMREKIKRADRLIDNGQGVEHTFKQILSLWESIHA
jgi:dephospho-CoA kinase